MSTTNLTDPQGACVKTSFNKELKGSMMNGKLKDAKNKNINTRSDTYLLSP
jgi:hypothetical protein